MKKIKIMLAAIAVLAVVGGALAFKAKKGKVVYCTTVNEPVKCTFPLDNYTTEFVNTTDKILDIECSDVTTSECPATTIYFKQ